MWILLDALSLDWSHYMVFIRNNIFIFKATVKRLHWWLKKPYSATYQINGNFIRKYICCQKIGQTIFFKKRLRKDFLQDGSWFLHSWTLQKCKKPHSNIILFSNLMWDSSGLVWLKIHWNPLNTLAVITFSVTDTQLYKRPVSYTHLTLPTILLV